MSEIREELELNIRLCLIVMYIDHQRCRLREGEGGDRQNEGFV